jgi:superfamily II DNA/RNA helicase
VLVFTRTKFGANNVAEFLTKNGIQSMALHGNKSQSARTQALQGFKSGDIRALVATDIAARGIDIDDLPHVVNYEIPNVCEDYVHRIGRTGRAGNEGASRQPGLPGRRRLHAGHRALHQARDRCRSSKASCPNPVKRPSPSPWAARPSGAAPASRQAAT